MNFLNTIQQRYMSMSPVEKRIADCILEDPEMMTKINQTRGLSLKPLQSRLRSVQKLI